MHIYRQARFNESNDLKVISTLLQSSLQPIVQPRNISQLSFLVKNRLSLAASTKQTRTSCKQWLQGKGIDIQPLFQYLAQQKKPQNVGRNNKANQDFIGNLVMQPILSNHEQYFKKSMQYSSTNILQCIPTNRIIRKRYFKQAMMRLNCLQSTNTVQTPIFISLTNRNLQKREKFIKCIKKLLQLDLQQKKRNESLFGYENVKENDLTAKIFFQNMNDKIWSIIYRQVKNIDFSKDKNEVITEILINSLSKIEQQFNEELPLNRQAMNYYLQQKYLSKFDKSGQYIFDTEHGSIWGKIFLYFRAGKMKQVVNLLQTLNERELLINIQRNVESIKRKHPEKIRIQKFLMKDALDVFRSQVLYAIGGERKYSSDILTNTSTLDCVWVLLRNTGIYYETDKQVFNQIKSQMVQHYRANNLLKQSIYFTAYLLQYDSIIKCSQSQFIDKDDFLHLLILLNRYPSIINDHDCLHQKLTEQSVQYAIQLALQHRQQFAYYILMIPHHKLVQEASTLIVTNKLYLHAPWEIFKRYLTVQFFGQLLKQCSQKFVKSTNNYIEAACNIVKHTKDKQEEGLCLLTQMLITHALHQKIYDRDQVNKSLQLYQCWMGSSPQLLKQYCQLFQLFNHLSILTTASINRNYRSAQDIISNKNLIFESNIDFYNHKMLDTLFAYNGLQVYFIYLSNLARVAEHLFNHSENAEELRKYKYSLFKTASTIVNHSKFNKFYFSQNIKNLIETLNYQLFEANSEKS